MSYQLVEQLQQKAVPVNQLCRVMSISRSGYYTARKRDQVQPAVCEASVHLRAAFAASGGAYGSRRLRTAVASRGVVIGIYRLRRLMRKHGLRSVWRRKFVHTTDSKHALPISPNVLNRQFNPTRPNQAWVADITYIRTRSGWLYLAVVLDLFARKVVGWAMAPDMQATLVCKALLRQRGNGALLPEFEDGARLAEGLRQPCRSHERRCALHRQLLQQPAAALQTGQLVTQCFRAEIGNQTTYRFVRKNLTRTLVTFISIKNANPHQPLNLYLEGGGTVPPPCYKFDAPACCIAYLSQARCTRRCRLEMRRR